MKRKCAMILLSCVLFGLVFCFACWKEEVHATPSPEPSVPGGYYNDPFVLKLNAPAYGKIYYTLDGSAPTTEDTLYTDGIRIVNRSSEPNIYNSYQRIIYDWQNFTPPPDPVEKGTVVRAIYINQYGEQSEILTQTYFVGIQPPERGYTLSLIFNEADVFGDDGIFVTGKEYDAWYLSGSTVPAPEANFEKKLEVPAIAELMRPDGDWMNQPVGIKIQGNSARKTQKKRFSIFAREEYSGSTVFDAELFSGVKTHSVMLKPEPIETVIYSLISDRSVSTQQSIPVRLFLNGEYWDDVFMLERYDNQYFRGHYDVKNRTLVKNGIMDEDTLATADLDYYSEFLYWVSHTDFSNPAQWEQVQKDADVQSYIDYIAINYYLCNFDFSDDKNYVLWRSANLSNSQYEDMRWRWCLYDMDALISAWYHPEMGDPAALNIFSYKLPYCDVRVNETVLFRALRKNPAYRQQFVTSFSDIVNNNFSLSRVERALGELGFTLDWQDGFFKKRPAYAFQHLAEEFGLTGSLETLTVKTAQPKMGSVQINTSVIDLDSGSWSGKYYTDYPVTATAIPKDGYTFVGWKGASSETASTIQLPMEGGPVLEAVFAEIK